MNADFLDTNVIIYLFDDVATTKQATAEQLVFKALDSGSAVISYQVIQESINVLTGKLRVHPSDVNLFLTSILKPLWKVVPSENLYQSALHVKSAHGFSFYDSLMIAAAMQAGCSRLLSEDLQHGQRFGSLEIVNPFLTSD